jgi:hypothetical protein
MTDAAVVIAALIVAIAGFITLVKYLPSPSTAGTTAVVGTATQAAATTASATNTSPTGTLTEQSISLAVIRTLAAQGSAWFLPTDQADQLLPGSIVRVLESRGVVLQVQLGAG